MGLALVTGAAGSIGFAVSSRLARAGYDVVVIDRSEQVETVAQHLRSEGVSAWSCQVDLGTTAGCESVVKTVVDLDQPLTVLVNNAGINRDGRAHNLTVEDYRHVIAVDLGAPIRLTLGLRDQMANGGSVINISSRAAFGNFGQSNYVAAKSGLIGFTRALALQWAPSVRVNALAPGLIETPMTDAIPSHVLEKMVAQIPLARKGQPEDIANAVAFLASPSSSYVTGQLIPVCGGRSVG